VYTGFILAPKLEKKVDHAMPFSLIVVVLFKLEEFS
jgi:hypothetical protein